MKTLIKNLAFIALVVFTLTFIGCEKEEVEPVIEETPDYTVPDVVVKQLMFYWICSKAIKHPYVIDKKDFDLRYKMNPIIDGETYYCYISTYMNDMTTENSGSLYFFKTETDWRNYVDKVSRVYMEYSFDFGEENVFDGDFSWTNVRFTDKEYNNYFCYRLNS